MSDTPRVGIEVAVDGSGVEAGLARVDAAVNRTGRNLDTLGERGGAALDEVGAHGTGAAGRVDAATRNMVNSIQRTTAALDAGSRSSREYYEALARQRGINTDALRPYLEQLEEVTQRQAAARAGLDATSGSLGNVGQSAAQTQAALRGVPAQITDIITSLQGGQAPLTVFLQQGGQLRDMFGSAGAAARALGSSLLSMINPYTVAAAAALALGAAYNEGSKEADAYSRALIMTGNAAATTVGELADMARQISDTVGTQGEAAAALAALAGTGDVSASNLQRFGEVAVRAQKSIGISVDETAQAFADLAKSPLAASEKLNEQYRYLTVAVYEQIKALEQQGRIEEAAEVAQNAYADAMGQRASAIKENLGTIERAWDGLKGVAKSAWDSMLNVGRADTLQDKLANVATQIAEQQKKLYSFIDAPDAKRRIAELRTLQSLLQDQVREQTKATEAQAAANAREQAGIELSKEASKYLDKEAQRQNELAAAREKAGAAMAGASQDRVKEIQAQLKSIEAGINEKYADKSKSNASAVKAETDAYAKLGIAIDERIAKTAREAAGLKPLTESQQLQVELDKLLAAGKQPLTAAAKAEYEAKIRTLGVNEQLIESHKRTAQAQADVEKLFKSLADERKREIDAATQEAERNELVAATYGMTKLQIEQLTLARLEDRLAQAASKGTVLEDIEHLRTLIDLKKRSVEALKEVDSREIAERSAKEAEEAWKRTAASIEESLTDALMRGFESGKSFAENLRDATVNMFKTMILRPTIQAALQPVSLPLSSALQTSGAGGLSMAANSAGSVLGIGSLLGSAGSIGAGAVQTAGALLTGQIGLGSTLSAGLSAIGTGSAAGISAGLSSVVGALGPIALGIAGVATILSKGFGRGPKTTTGQGITGTFGVESFTGENYTEWMKKGGWFSSTKRGTDYSALGTEQASALNSAYAAIKSSTSAFAEALGVPADVVTAYSKTIRLAFTGDAAKDQETLAALFVQMGNELATRVVPNIEQFIQQGEAAATTLQRVANNFTSMNTIMQAIGVDASSAFGAVGVASLEARERLLSLAGGVDALAQQTDYFAQNFLSEAERMAPIQKAVNEQLAKLGYAGVKTSDQFKGAIMDLVNGGGLATQAGAQTYAALLALAPAFKQVADYAEQTAAAQVAAAEEAKAAAEAAANAAAEAAANAVALLQTAAGDAFSALQRSVNAQKESARAAFDDLMAGIEASITAASSKVNTLQSLASALLSANVAGVTDAQLGARQQDAQAQLAAALAIAKASGVLPSADSLKDALAAVSVDTSDRYATFADFQRDQLRTAGTIKELSDITDTELSVSQRALATLQDQKKAAQEAFDAEMAMYDEMLEKAQQQLDAINGVRTDVMTVAAAFNSFAASIAKALGNPTIGNQPSVDGRTQIESLYNSVLGRTSDAAGLQYYLGLYNSGASLGNIKQDLMNSDEYKKLRGFAVGTNYVPETMPALIHEGERIIPAADNRALMAALERPGRDDSAVVAELQALRAEVATLRAFTVQTAQNTGKTSDLINNISGGGGPLLVQLEEA